MSAAVSPPSNEAVLWDRVKLSFFVLNVNNKQTWSHWYTLRAKSVLDYIAVVKYRFCGKSVELTYTSRITCISMTLMAWVRLNYIIKAKTVGFYNKSVITLELMLVFKGTVSQMPLCHDTLGEKFFLDWYYVLEGKTAVYIGGSCFR